MKSRMEQLQEESEQRHRRDAAAVEDMRREVQAAGLALIAANEALAVCTTESEKKHGRISYDDPQTKKGNFDENMIMTSVSHFPDSGPIAMSNASQHVARQLQFTNSFCYHHHKVQEDQTYHICLEHSDDASELLPLPPLPAFLSPSKKSFNGVKTQYESMFQSSESVSPLTPPQAIRRRPPPVPEVASHCTSTSHPSPSPSSSTVEYQTDDNEDRHANHVSAQETSLYFVSPNDSKNTTTVVAPRMPRSGMRAYASEEKNVVGQVAPERDTPFVQHAMGEASPAPPATPPWPKYVAPADVGRQTMSNEKKETNEDEFCSVSVGGDEDSRDGFSHSSEGDATGDIDSSDGGDGAQPVTELMTAGD